MTTPVASIAEPVRGPAPGAEIARDMVRRGVLLMPFVVTASALIGGVNVAISVGYGMLIVMINFLASAYLLVWAARISLGLVASVALGGYVMRLALVFMAVWLVKDTSWVRMIPLGITIIATHLGLLVWELRYVSASFAHPGLKPQMEHNTSRTKLGQRPLPAARAWSPTGSRDGWCRRARMGCAPRGVMWRARRGRAGSMRLRDGARCGCCW